MTLRQLDPSPAVTIDALGYPKAAGAPTNPLPIIERNHKAVVLENQYVKATVLPELGRMYSLVSKTTGHELLWTNAIAKPLFNQHNALGWWMVWGGIEWTIPGGEHGTTWALPWHWNVSEKSSRRVAIKMSVLEPETRLRESIEVILDRDSAAVRIRIGLRNESANEVPFAFWVNPMFAPGGRGEITARTELIVPCDGMRVAERDFNRWMLGARVQEFSRNPLRYVENWRSIGDLLAENLTADFYSAFSHEANEGIARIFDRRITPGMDIWTWGYPPPPERQREYSLEPNLGYVEMWGGIARDFSDGARGSLPARGKLQWDELLIPYNGTGGLTFANGDFAVNYRYSPETSRLTCAIQATRPMRDVVVRLSHSGKTIKHGRFNLSPELVFSSATTLSEAAEDFRLTIKQKNRTLMETRAAMVEPIRWGGEYLPQR